MSRIRSIHPAQWTDEDFVSCSPLARLLDLGLRNEADDNGIFRWSPVALKMRILPADSVDMGALLAELVEARQIARYEVDGKAHGIIRNFRRFQSPRRPTYDFKPPRSGQVPNEFLLEPATDDQNATSSDPIPDNVRNEAASTRPIPDNVRTEPPSTPVIPDNVRNAPPLKPPNSGQVEIKDRRFPLERRGRDGIGEERKKDPPSNHREDAAGATTIDLDAEARTVVETFHRLVEHHFGNDPPETLAPKDLSIAKAWLQDGLEYEPIRAHFDDRMGKMAAMKRERPRGLLFFNNAIREDLGVKLRRAG